MPSQLIVHTQEFAPIRPEDFLFLPQPLKFVETMLPITSGDFAKNTSTLDFDIPPFAPHPRVGLLGSIVLPSWDDICMPVNPGLLVSYQYQASLFRSMGSHYDPYTGMTISLN